MKCPFRLSTTKTKDTQLSKTYTHCYFEDCHGDECPFYYRDYNDVEKCARVHGPEEEL